MGVEKDVATIYVARCNYCSRAFLSQFHQTVKEFDSMEDLKDEIEAFNWDFINEDHIRCPKCREEQIEYEISESRYE